MVSLGDAVCCPAGVCDTDVANAGGGFERGFKLDNLAECSYAVDVGFGLGVTGQQGDAGRVIAAIFEPLQSFYQHWADIGFRDGGDDPAHLFFLPSGRATPARDGLLLAA